MHGTARYYFEAQQQFSSPSGTMSITSISVYGSSASFDAGDSSLTASVSVLKGNTTVAKVNLVRPTGASVEAPVGANETRRLYLPQGQTLTVPTGGELSVSVSASKKHCSINNSVHLIDPFAAPAAAQRPAQQTANTPAIAGLNTLPRQTAEPCVFEPARLEYRGDAAEQALCLLRHVGMFEHIDTVQPPIDKTFLSLIGKPINISTPDATRFLERQGIAAALIGGDLGSLSTPRSAYASPKYFVIHDVSSPNYKNLRFPIDINSSSWMGNDLSSWRNDTGAHVYINRLGQSVTARNFNTPWRATKFEKQQGAKVRGLFLQVELIQPRRSYPPGSSTNDALAPVPGFTAPQLDRLAQIYVIARVRAGKWLIPAFHGVIDQGIPNAHDDPQHFDTSYWISAVLSVFHDIDQNSQIGINLKSSTLKSTNTKS